MSRYLTAVMLTALSTAYGATYTQLSSTICDTRNHVQYDGQGNFAVESAPQTTVEVTLNLNSLLSYVNSNDYKSGSPMMLWKTNAINYGIADIADTQAPTGERKPRLCFYWGNGTWQESLNIDYETLQKHALTDGSLKLRVENNQAQGVRVSALNADNQDTLLLQADKLKSSRINKTNGYHVNLNYVTAFGINTPSVLKLENYVPRADYTKVFESTREDGTTLKRVMFLGDSITHGVNDQTWRWQLFKILVDNGIEAEIVGPRTGYTPGYTQMTTPDAGTAYAGIDFPNKHLAQSSGRTHNIISGSNSGMSGVNYGGHSTAGSAATYNCDTWCCLMGTNDLLSDAGYSEQDFIKKMSKLIGGNISFKKGKYTRKAGADWGTMGQIAQDILKESTDTLYIMAVPCWGNHQNNNQPERHLTVADYNKLLSQWVDQYSKKHAKNLVFVDINQGLIDYSNPVPFSWPDSMSNRPGRDGLHPNAQGSLIIAGNLARALNIGGRTAGLPRAAADSDWKSAKIGDIGKQKNNQYALEAFSAEQGYSVELRATVGKNTKGATFDNSKTLRLEIGDGTQGGVLQLSAGNIMWGDTVLYCTRKLPTDQHIRIVWHSGNQSLNVQAGYYVWIGDMLIGHGLPASDNANKNGITITANGTTAAVHTLKWTDKALAPVTSNRMNEQHSFKLPAAQ